MYSLWRLFALLLTNTHTKLSNNMAAKPTISKHVIKEIIVIYLKGIYNFSILFYVLYREMIVCSGWLISLLQLCCMFFAFRPLSVQLASEFVYAVSPRAVERVLSKSGSHSSCSSDLNEYLLLF